MVYVVEISFSTKRTKCVEKTLHNIETISDRYECINNYHIVENLGKKYNYDNIYVVNCSFESECESESVSGNGNANGNAIYYNINFIDFLKEIKKNKEYNIDMIMNNDTMYCNVIYMSPYYLKNMPKEERRSFITQQRTRSYSESDYMIMKQFTKEISKYNNELVENKLQFQISYSDYLKLLDTK